jgi:hypothetical protein
LGSRSTLSGRGMAYRPPAAVGPEGSVVGEQKSFNLGKK